MCAVSRSNSTPTRAISASSTQPYSVFSSDAIKFPDLVHSVWSRTAAFIPGRHARRDFISLLPENAGWILWIMSIPPSRSLRMMEGSGIHTFRLVNADGKWTFVKFHWLDDREAVKINGADPDFHRRDL